MKYIKAPTIDVSPTEEKDLIGTFREYCKLSGGPFPDLLDMGSLYQMVMMKNVLRVIAEKPSAKQQQEMAEAQVKLQRGLMFAVQLPKEADSHYAGKGVSLGAADKPIFWYRPKDAKKYRVIYADLSVRDAATPPSVPVAQAGEGPDRNAPPLQPIERRAFSGLAGHGVDFRMS